MGSQRLNPEQLLARAKEEERQAGRGKLKIYLGAAPGVGKTYAMLQDAQEKRRNGLDVLVGIAESHGREDIDRLLANMDMLPRQSVKYHGTTCSEFDLDAALKRHPGLILMDEMAHTNAPGLRHSKRWQDIQELLDRGIDVYTTLNVQHIESLKDDVAQIIQAPIKETVPDSMIERADTIELIDLPPEDLLKRLQDGKVYIPKQAELAKEHFFRKGNLIALRELALRITAERVGTDVLWYRQGEGIKKIWPIRDKILVCVGPKPESLKLIRAAKRMVSSLQAEWIAIYIDTPKLQANEAVRNKAIENLRLAELLGAETHVISGFDIVREVMSFSREQNVTQIMIWKHIRTRWRDWFRRNLVDEIVRHSGEISVYIMTGESSKDVLKGNNNTRPGLWKAYIAAVGAVSIATVLNVILYPSIASGILVMIYLLSVAIVALFGYMGPSILASILTVLAYNYFFIPYFRTSLLSDIEYFITLLVMLLVTQIIGHLTILIRRQAEASRLAQYQTTMLYTFTRKLTRTRGVDKLLALGVPYIASAFNSNVMVLLPTDNHLDIHFSYPHRYGLNAKEESIAQWVYEMGQPAGVGTETLSFSNALYLPLLGTSGPIGVLRINRRSQKLFTPDQRGLLESYTNQLALALEVERLNDKTRKRELEIEADKARTSVLRAIFNDLCFPLQRVIAAVNGLREIEGAKIRAIEDNIDLQINKLNRLNNNLYQIIQLESQCIELKKVPASLQELIISMVNISNKTLEERPIHLDIPKDLPLIMLDSRLIQEVLFHLLDNAIKFSPPHSPIALSALLGIKQVVVRIEDCGSGIVPAEKNKLFKKFYRSKKVITQHGLGLGLAICEKIINAHEGVIWVENIEHKGAAFSFSLPVGSEDEGVN